MDNVLTIILIVMNSILILSAFIKMIFNIKQNKQIALAQPQDLSTIYDTQQNYLEVINNFIRKEFLYELKKWISTTSKTINISEGSIPKFFDELTSPDMLQDKLSKSTALIISKMSPDMINGFYRVYSRNFSYLNDSSFIQSNGSMENDSLYMYVARILGMYTNRIVTEITVMKNEYPEEPNTSIISKYLLEINTEIYILDNVYIIKPETRHEGE